MIRALGKIVENGHQHKCDNNPENEILCQIVQTDYLELAYIMVPRSLCFDASKAWLQ